MHIQGHTAHISVEPVIVLTNLDNWLLYCGTRRAGTEGGGGSLASPFGAAAACRFLSSAINACFFLQSEVGRRVKASKVDAWYIQFL